MSDIYYNWTNQVKILRKAAKKTMKELSKKGEYANDKFSISCKRK
ncbi:hypothetical protein [Streptococcus suis]